MQGLSNPVSRRLPPQCLARASARHLLVESSFSKTAEYAKLSRTPDKLTLGCEGLGCRVQLGESNGLKWRVTWTLRIYKGYMEGYIWW